MVEKRNVAKRKDAGDDPGKDDCLADEIHLETMESKGDEETKGEASVEPTKSTKGKRVTKFPEQRPLNRETVQAYSRWLHRNTPLNRYFRVKVPWKTIAIAFLFLCVGTVLLYIGINELLTTGTETEAWEKVVLGAMLFIPGSFHSFLAVQALRGVPGYDYEHLTVFENEKFFEED